MLSEDVGFNQGSTAVVGQVRVQASSAYRMSIYSARVWAHTLTYIHT